jgi:hypothetical protein
MSFDLCAVDIVLVGIYARVNETEPREHSKDDRWASTFWLTPHTVSGAKRGVEFRRDVLEVQQIKEHRRGL